MSTLVDLKIGTPHYDVTPDLVLLTHVDQDGSKKVRAFASAFFAYVGQYLVLFTAAHAFDGLEGKPILAVGNKGAVSLSKAKIVRSRRFDIAAIFLESTEIALLMQDLICVTPIEIETVKDSCSGAIYQMHGYPSSKNTYSPTAGWKRHLIRVSFGECRSAPAKSPLPKEDFTPFFFELSLKNLVDDNGEKDSHLSQLEGMSGCPVYRYGASGVDAAKGRLIGMFVHWDKHEKVATVIPWQELEQLVLAASVH